MDFLQSCEWFILQIYYKLETDYSIFPDTNGRSFHFAQSYSVSLSSSPHISVHRSILKKAWHPKNCKRRRLPQWRNWLWRIKEFQARLWADYWIDSWKSGKSMFQSTKPGRGSTWISIEEKIKHLNKKIKFGFFWKKIHDSLIILLLDFRP